MGLASTPLTSPHIPVLERETLAFLAPRDGGVYLDGTFGAGGHSRAILNAADCRVIGLDRDESAITAGSGLVQAAAGRLTLVQQRFSELETAARSVGVTQVDGVLLDIGVSSMQLDRAERGFSFRNDGPLDMRMGRDGPSVADIVAAASERDLATIIATLGEERFARLIARAIVSARQRQPTRSTRALSDIVEGVVRSKPGEIHPATRTFQALRMFVNAELTELASALGAAERLLAPGGRLAVITFHSLEDRIVKRFLVSRGRVAPVSRHQPLAVAPEPSFRLLTGRPVVAAEDEVQGNPRARSAKLRAAERTAAPPLPLPVESVPALPDIDAVLKGR